MSRDNPTLMSDTELIENFTCILHRRQIRLTPHDDAYQRFIGFRHLISP